MTIVAPPAGLAIVVILGLAQGLLAAVRALAWVEVGTDMIGRGAIILPVLGALAFARGLLVAAIALLYAGFAWGALVGRRWARGLGLAAALLNLLLVVGALVHGAPPLEALPWAVVPVILIVYLFTPAGRQALAR